jgi:hypothetical protein
LPNSARHSFHFPYPIPTGVDNGEPAMMNTKRAALFTIPDSRLTIPGFNWSPHEIR